MAAAHDPYASNPYQAPSASGSGAEESGEVSIESVDILRQTRPWVAFIAILGFVGTALALIVWIIEQFSLVQPQKPPPPPLESIVNLATCAMYGAMALFLAQYSRRIKQLVAHRTMDNLEGALTAQHSFWRLAGVLTVVMIILFVVMAVVIAIQVHSRVPEELEF